MILAVHIVAKDVTNADSSWDEHQSPYRNNILISKSEYENIDYVW